MSPSNKKVSILIHSSVDSTSSRFFKDHTCHVDVSIAFFDNTNPNLAFIVYSIIEHCLI